MKCNAKELAVLSDQPCVIEGRLNYKKISNGSYRHQTVFKERWFRLVKNYLFYFKISEMGKFDTKNPAGVFVMENSSIQMEHGHSIPFAFSISFIDEHEKRHMFAARTEENVVQWVMKLRQCSYEYLRNRLHTLQSRIYSITGKDPLLLIPRNDGAYLWAPSVPFSTAPACTTNTTSFNCHLHTNGAFTLERSKSDVQAHKHIRHDYSSKTRFYTDDAKSDESKRQPSPLFGYERSKTSDLLSDSASNISSNIFDKRPLYSRAAPSPPARARVSPASRRAAASEHQLFTEQGKQLGSTGILDEPPIPPKRKISPKPNKLNVDTSETGDSSAPNESSEDLIQF